MTVARVNQGKPDFPSRNEVHVKKNLFDLSYDHKMTFKMGQLIPFLLLETLPSDEFFIKGEYMFRFAPLFKPIMHRVNMSVDYFYVPNRILWPGTSQDSWEFFITSVDAVPVPNFDWANTDPEDAANSLLPYMGLPGPIAVTGILQGIANINALPLSSYLKIYDEYYRNDQIQGPRWFELVSGDNTAAFVAELGIGFAPLYRNWNRDYYTSQTYLPQIGADTLIPLVNTDYLVNGLDYDGPTIIRAQDDDAILPNEITIGTGPQGQLQIGGSENAYLDIQASAATIRQLREAVITAEYLERLNRAGDRYRDVIFTFFDEDPMPWTVDRPVYLGGKKGRVVISDVLSTAEIGTGEDQTLAAYAGQAVGLESVNNAIQYHCKEHGWIMGIVSVYPTSSYMQGLHRMWRRLTRYDYAWEQFALIGDQAVRNEEVMYNFKNTVPLQNWNNETFGYIKRYGEYQYSNDVVSGQMRTIWNSFHLGRIFDQDDPDSLVLEEEFLYCIPRVTDVFKLNPELGEHEVFAHIFNDVQVLRRLPKNGIPTL